MHIKTEHYRIIAGMIVCPWILVVAWSIPYINHSAFSKWIVINTFLAFFIFFLTAGISHFVLRALSLVKWWHYSLIMFCVCLLLYYGILTSDASRYTELYHSQTLVVESGRITRAGHILNFGNAVAGSLLSAAAFLMFWMIAVWKPNGSSKNASE
jgi:small-conductance mechanosensitive channel